jgi:hypothetical protein
MMRQLWTWRTLAALAGVAIIIVLGIVVVSIGSPDDTDGEILQPRVRRVEAVASVMRIQSTTDFSSIDGLTTGAAVLALDDGRTVSIAAGTPGELSCSERAVPAACVLLADLLGDGVVWYALVDADTSASRTLILPTLVDMVDGGDTGILQNGWHVPLANGVTRTCAGEPRSRHLRAFINSYADSGIRTVLDLDRDEVVEVICVR